MQAVDLTEECFSDMCAFLDTLRLTADEAQIIWEVATYRQHHVDLDTLSKKIPTEFQTLDVTNIVKKLINEGYLQPYGAKKDVLCVLCTSLGRDIVELIRDNCYSYKLKHFNRLAQKYGKRDYLTCFDPQGFKEGEKRYARGPEGEKICILIKKKCRSDRIFRLTKEGTPVYEIKLKAEIVGCPQCDRSISLEFSYNPNSCYREYKQLCCECGFEFMLAYSLSRFYYL